MKAKMKDIVSNLLGSVKNKRSNLAVKIEVQPAVNKDDTDWDHIVEVANGISISELNSDRELICKFYSQGENGNTRNPYGVCFSRLTRSECIRERMQILNERYLTEPDNVRNQYSSQLVTTNTKQRKILGKTNSQRNQ